jgi:ATP-dependent DNA helicase DinG
VDDLLGPGGALDRVLPAYEHRGDQLEMARAVERALTRRHHLVVEAGTGTGKTLAYLVPAALSGRRVVISTATKALQEQIWWKDLPLLRDRCGLGVEAAYLKGRSNYLCLERLVRFERAPTFTVRDEADQWPALRDWADATETGDRAELDLPDQFAAWKDLSATSDTCLGRECDLYDECFVTRARARAAEAQLVLVNHHLYLADLGMRTGAAGAEVLPGHDVVIFDEAHALEEVATEYFGLEVSSWRVEELARDAARAVGDRPDLAAMMKELTGELRRAGERYFEAVGGALRAAAGAGRGGGRARRGDEEPARAALQAGTLEATAEARHRLDAALDQLRDTLADADTTPLAQLARRASEVRVELAAVTAANEPTRVYFGEVRGRGVYLRAAPLDVGGELRQRLFARLDTTIFTSATLCAQGRFDFFRRQVGLDETLEVEEARFPGPFDFTRQAALVVPDGLPEPNQPGFVEAAAAVIAELCAVTGGRAFVLCTSHRNMQAFHAAAAGLPWPRLLQGERPKHRLLEAFRAEPSVLFATASFWEGVDVPGEALSLVVIDRLPFSPPNDPVVAARLAALEADGRDGFSELQADPDHHRPRAGGGAGPAPGHQGLRPGLPRHPAPQPPAPHRRRGPGLVGHGRSRPRVIMTRAGRVTPNPESFGLPALPDPA